MCAGTQNKILQPSDGVMIVVPSACLTKTLTQQLVVYSFALDNRMCSSIRPQITQSVKMRRSRSLPPFFPPSPSLSSLVPDGQAMCVNL